MKATLDPLLLSILSEALASTSGASSSTSATATAVVYTAPATLETAVGEAGNSVAEMASAADVDPSLASGPSSSTQTASAEAPLLATQKPVESENEGSINPFPPSPQ